MLGLSQFQNWGWARIISSGKDRIARCVVERRMTSDLTQYSDLDCVGDVLLDLVVGQEALASTFAFTVLGLLPSRIPEEYPYTNHRYPSE